MQRTDQLKRLVLAAMFLALCVIGANLKMMGSIAFDSMPAFLGAILMGPWYGAILGIFGHLLSAGLAGFPLSLPVHGVIAGCMGVCMFLFGKMRHGFEFSTISRVLLSDIIGYAVNVPLALVILYPIMGAAVLAFFVPLTLATVVNIVICEVVYVALPSRMTHASFLV
ncbi:ECF transporter S component [uncultured Secundilactobacillus sp.]|uniref:ECF transporter S component n=1 Tax=uncultured Secundilactobacillus sp. TaxID=2813935 RepID=UPI0025885C99|nr:ECF transporter S component [uncultured Secundilactobacillus sp.]